MDVVETHSQSGFTLTIWRDEDAMNPRHDSNLGVLYILRPPRGMSMTDVAAYAPDAESAPIKIPIYVLDHGGISIRSRPFHCPWDSWRAGTYYVTEETIVAEYGDSTPASLALAERVARAELDVYARWVEGETYGYTISKGDADITSCGGYYGRESLPDILCCFERFIKEEFIKDCPLFAWAGIELT